MSLPLPEDRSPYANFIRGLNDYHDGEEPLYILMTMLDRNGSVLCETDEFDLLLAIIYRNEATTLEQDLDIAPWAIEDDEELPYYCSFFYTAVSHGSLIPLRFCFHTTKELLDQEKESPFKNAGSPCSVKLLGELI
jgi:hypothetical protein